MHAILASDPALAALRDHALQNVQTGDPSHDGSHLERVAQAALWLARQEGAQPRIVLAAAFLHDLVNVPKHHPERAQASRASALAAAQLLGAFGFSAGEIGRVAAAIEEHSFSRGLPCSSLESAVLQDADRLDALGAIGLWRTASCGALMGATYYDPDDPFATARELDDRRHTLDHFPKKLLRLADAFNTESGRREARRRTRFMWDFLRQLGSELPSTGPAVHRVGWPGLVDAEDPTAP